MLAESFIEMTRFAPGKTCNAFLYPMKEYSNYLKNFIATFESIGGIWNNIRKYIERHE